MSDGSRFLQQGFSREFAGASMVLDGQVVTIGAIRFDEVFAGIDVNILGKNGVCGMVYSRLMERNVAYEQTVLIMSILEDRIQRYFEVMACRDAVRTDLLAQIKEQEEEMAGAWRTFERVDAKGEKERLQRRLDLLDKGDPAMLEVLLGDRLSVSGEKGGAFSDFKKALLVDRLALISPDGGGGIVDKVAEVSGVDPVGVGEIENGLKMGTADGLWSILSETSRAAGEVVEEGSGPLNLFLKNELYGLFEDPRHAEVAKTFQPKDLRRRPMAQPYNEDLGWMYAVLKPLTGEKRELALVAMARAMMRRVGDLRMAWEKMEATKRTNVTQRMAGIFCKVDLAWGEKGVEICDDRTENFLEENVYNLLQNDELVAVAKQLQPKEFVLKGHSLKKVATEFSHEQTAWIYCVLKRLKGDNAAKAIAAIAQALGCDPGNVLELWTKISKTKRQKLPERMARVLNKVDVLLSPIRRVVKKPVEGRVAADGGKVPLAIESSGEQPLSAITFGPGREVEDVFQTDRFQSVDGVFASAEFGAQKQGLSRVSLADESTLRLGFEGFEAAQVKDFLLGKLSRHPSSNAIELPIRWRDLFFGGGAGSVPVGFTFGTAFNSGRKGEGFSIPEIPELSRSSAEGLDFKKMRMVLSFLFGEMERDLKPFFSVIGRRETEKWNQQLDLLYNFCLQQFFDLSRPKKMKVLEKNRGGICVEVEMGKDVFQNGNAEEVLRFCLLAAKDLYAKATVPNPRPGAKAEMLFVDERSWPLDGEERRSGFTSGDKLVYAGGARLEIPVIKLNAVLKGAAGLDVEHYGAMLS